MAGGGFDGGKLLDGRRVPLPSSSSFHGGGGGGRSLRRRLLLLRFFHLSAVGRARNDVGLASSSSSLSASTGGLARHRRSGRVGWLDTTTAGATEGGGGGGSGLPPQHRQELPGMAAMSTGCLEMTEHAVLRLGKCQQKWVMCPTCRQHTDFGNIAYVDDKQSEICQLRIPKSIQGENLAEMSLKVEGSYGTKIEAITRRILWICSSDQDAKVLVFSSWNDVLNLLEHALHENNISYTRMKGGRKSQAAIAQFKGQEISKHMNSQGITGKSKSVQVLLLLIQHGANGLNILEAQHVILVEPLLNPAAEAQAINRVHRVGQEKKTFVHRFIVENTVEESIYNLNKTRNVSSVIGTKSKHQDQPALTLKDIESIFQPTLPKKTPEADDLSVEGSLRHLQPQVAAGLAAERRLMEASS